MQHRTGSREEWLAARLELLRDEKELTRRSDELAKRRQELPWVRVQKDYFFETSEGNVSLAELFQGRSQLLVYHFMFGPDYTAGCPSCSSIADSFNGTTAHLAHHDVMLWAVSRAPLAKLQAYQQRMGWTFPWASSCGNDFNFDFNVSFTEEQQQSGSIEYNYRHDAQPMDSTTPVPESLVQIARYCGTDAPAFTRDRPGLSAFVIEQGVIYHTYSAYSRGLDSLWGMYQWLDRAPYGRNESGFWIRRHDEYESSVQNLSGFSSDASLRTERVLAFTPQQIFTAFERPELLAQWWGPDCFRNTFQQFEFTPGGKWNFVMHGPDGKDYPNESLFQEIHTNSKVVISHVSQPRFTLSVTLTTQQNGTHLAWVQEFENDKVATSLRAVCEPANEQNLDRLQSLLTKESP